MRSPSKPTIGDYLVYAFYAIIFGFGTLLAIQGSTGDPGPGDHLDAYHYEEPSAAK